MLDWLFVEKWLNDVQHCWIAFWILEVFNVMTWLPNVLYLRFSHEPSDLNIFVTNSHRQFFIGCTISANFSLVVDALVISMDIVIEYDDVMKEY